MTKVIQKSLKTDLPELKPGQIVKVHQKIIEAGKERIQVFEGIVLDVHGGQGIDGTITVRKDSFGVGVEKIFSIHSPNVAKIEVIKEYRTKRAKLFHLRDPLQLKKFLKGKEVTKKPAEVGSSSGGEATIPKTPAPAAVAAAKDSKAPEVKKEAKK